MEERAKEEERTLTTETFFSKIELGKDGRVLSVLAEFFSHPLHEKSEFPVGKLTFLETSSAEGAPQ